MSTPEDLSLRFRSRFLVPEGVVELRAFTHGLMPCTVPEMMARFAEDWALRGVDAWNQVPNHWDPGDPTPVGWWNLPEYLGDRFIAPLLGAQPGSCILLPSVHWAVQALLSCPEPFRGRRRLVWTEAEFPSVRHSALRWAQAEGWEAVETPYPSSAKALHALLEAITTNTALVFVSHVAFLTGERLPDAVIAELVDRCRKTGSLLALDGYHAAGSRPIRVQELGVDFYLGGLLKEGCGSTGNAFLYIRPGLELNPRLGGWVGEADPFAFEEAYRPHPSVRRRFLGGTPAIAPLYHAVEGVRILLEAGLEAVEADNAAKTQWLLEAIRRSHVLGRSVRIASPEDPDRRGPMLVLEVPEAECLVRWLAQRGILLDSRRNRRVRLAPFVWNSYPELERSIETLQEALRSGAYQEAPRSLGPVP